MGDYWRIHHYPWGGS